jgi:enoyl-CoA hydratase
MSYQNILTSVQDKITIITINRPNKLNALNKETILELSRAISEADTNEDCRVIILTGSGDKAFVAGADIAEFSDFDESQGAELAEEGQGILFDFIANLGTPVIAAINGYALGGGLELAMSAHFRIASENAKMGLPEVSLGLIPGYGGTQRLPQLVGKGKAMELIMTAGMLNADEALKWGLVNHVVALDDLMEFTIKIATKISQNSSTAIASAICAINAGFEKSVNGFETEISEFGNCFGTEDFVEGTTAFLEKRKPNF